jgi:hypothetical protein
MNKKTNKTKYVFGAFLLFNIVGGLFGENGISLNAKAPDILSYEDVINAKLSKQAKEKAQSQNPQPQQNNVTIPKIDYDSQQSTKLPEKEEKIKFEYNIVGTLLIDENKKIAYLLNNQSKLITIEKGSRFDGFIISDVTKYGVDVMEEKTGRNMFYPILETKIEEANIVFTSNRKQ